MAPALPQSVHLLQAGSGSPPALSGSVLETTPGYSSFPDGMGPFVDRATKMQLVLWSLGLSWCWAAGIPEMLQSGVFFFFEQL